MDKSIFILAVCLILLPSFGCSEIKDPNKIDQCLRRQIFQECMQQLPAGPQETKYNDWNEVVDSCGKQAYHQSLRRESQIKPECIIN